MAMTRENLKPGVIIQGRGSKAAPKFHRRIELWSGNECVYRIRGFNNFGGAKRQCFVSTICEWADKIISYPAEPESLSTPTDASGRTQDEAGADDADF